MSKKDKRTDWKALFFEALSLVEDSFWELDNFDNGYFCRFCDAYHYKKPHKIEHEDDCQLRLLRKLYAKERIYSIITGRTAVRLVFE